MSRNRKRNGLPDDMFIVLNNDQNEDKDLRVCRGCLATDVNLHKLNRNVSTALSQITGNPVMHRKDPLPEYICSSCSYLAVKYSKFRKKCVNTEVLLNRYMLWNKMNMQNIQKIDRSELESSLSITPIFVTSCNPNRYNPNMKITTVLHYDIPVTNDCSSKNIKNKNTITKENVPAKASNNVHSKNDYKVIVSTSQYRNNDVCTKEKLLSKTLQNQHNITYNDLIQDRYTVLATDGDRNVLLNDILKRVVEDFEGISKQATENINNTNHNTMLDDVNSSNNWVDQESKEELKEELNSIEFLEDEQNNIIDNNVQEEFTEKVVQEELIDKDEQEDLMDTKDDIIVKEENLIHPVDDDVDETEATTKQKDDENTQIAKEAENSTEKDIEDDVISFTSTSSSSSSTSSDSDSSSSSDSDDEIEMQVIKPTEIDLTIDDDDVNVPPDVPKINDINVPADDPKVNDNGTNVAPDLPKVDDNGINVAPDAPKVNEKDINGATNELKINDNDINVPPDHLKDKLESTASNPALDKDKTVDDLEVERQESPKQMNTSENDIQLETKDRTEIESAVVEESNEPNTVGKATETDVDDVTMQDDRSNSEETVKEKVSATDHNLTDNKGEGSHSNKEVNNKKTPRNTTTSDSSDSDDMPDCLFGFNEDIYKKDTKRNFSKSETDIDHKREKIRYVDDIYVEDKNSSSIKKRTIDEVCDNVSNGNGKIGEFDKVRQEFESKRRRRFKMAVNRKRELRRNRTYVVPR